LDATDRAAIMERGAIVYEGPSLALAANRQLLETHLGVAGKTQARRAPLP
jgi:ABC-type branched-subunit amino acid transport system ATPase component